jgi:hypothetical protein
LGAEKKKESRDKADRAAMHSLSLSGLFLCSPAKAVAMGGKCSILPFFTKGDQELVDTMDQKEYEEEAIRLANNGIERVTLSIQELTCKKRELVRACAEAKRRLDLNATTSTHSLKREDDDFRATCHANFKRANSKILAYRAMRTKLQSDLDMLERNKIYREHEDITTGLHKVMQNVHLPDLSSVQKREEEQQEMFREMASHADRLEVANTQNARRSEIDTEEALVDDFDRAVEEAESQVAATATAARVAQSTWAAPTGQRAPSAFLEAATELTSPLSAPPVMSESHSKAPLHARLTPRRHAYPQYA